MKYTAIFWALGGEGLILWINPRIMQSTLWIKLFICTDTLKWGFFMFCWPYISMCTCNENHLYALFIPCFFFTSVNLYMFRTYLWPIIGRYTVYIYNTYQLLYIYSVPPDDGPQICPKHVEVDWRNKLRINSVSSWFPLHGHLCRFYIDAEILKILTMRGRILCSYSTKSW